MRALVLALLLASPALAADHEVDLEMRSTVTSDASYRMFNDTDGLGTWGVRGAFALHENVKIAGSWSHGGRGLKIHTGPDGEGFRTSLKIETLGLGVKGGWLFQEVVGPIATVQGLMLLGRARFDEDATVDDNPGQYRRSGVAFGLSATAGLEGRLVTASRYKPAVSLEFGYLRTTNLGLDELGDLHFGGFTARGSLGLRF